MIFKNKKIAILTPTFMQFSGIDRVVELQAKDFLKHGNEVTIMALKAGMRVKGAKVIVVGMPKSHAIERVYRLFFFLDKKKIKRAAAMLKDYDIIISHLYPMNLIASYAKKHYNINYIYHNHGIAFPGLFSNKAERMYMHLFKTLTNKSIRNADKVISISNFLRNELKKETGISSEVEYDHIDTKRFHKGIDKNRIRKKYNIKNEPLCLYVGRISPHKGIHLLIAAFNLVLERIPDAKLIIAGKPTFNTYFNSLKKMAKKNIIFTDFVDDKSLPSYYAACDVYTTASLWEGFNMTIAEANACGKPAVAFNVAAHPEVIKKGKLVEKENVRAFADAIISLLKKK